MSPGKKKERATKFTNEGPLLECERERERERKRTESPVKIGYAIIGNVGIALRENGGFYVEITWFARIVYENLSFETTFSQARRCRAYAHPLTHNLLILVLLLPLLLSPF